MSLPRFEHCAANNVEAALALLAEESSSALIAGGTDLLMLMKNRLITPARLIALKGIDGLSFVQAEPDGGVRIGALTRLVEIIKSPIVNEKFPVLVEAARLVGSPHHQEMGTIGGNLCLETRCMYYNQSSFWRKSREACFKTGGEVCHTVRRGTKCYAVYCGDLAPSLMALGASVRLTSAIETREIPLEEFYVDDGQQPNVLTGKELMTEIRIPALAGKAQYKKFRLRGSIDFPAVGVAAAVDSAGVKVVLNAVGSIPIRVKEIETLFATREAQGLTIPQAIEEAAALAYQAARPYENIVMVSVSYRRKIAKVYTKQILTALLLPDDQIAEVI